MALPDDRVARLESAVEELEQRLARLEAVASAGSLAGGALEDFSRTTLPAGGTSSTELRESTLQRWLGLAGRTLVVLGGAYLLRALTESHVLSAPVGVGMGLLYGAPWLALSSRAAARGAHLDALCHALATALIGYPLVWEATVRFQVLTPPQSAALIAALTGAALALSWVRMRQELAWVVTIGGLASALTLAMATGTWISYTVVVVGVGIATLWLGYTREWIALRWPAALVADFMLAIITGRAVFHGGVRAALTLQLLTLAAYLASFAARTLILGREVIPFEVAQSAGVLLVAFGGAIYLIEATGANVVPVGLGSMALAVAGYHVGFAFVERRHHVKNFFFYTVIALVFALIGVATFFGAAAGSVVYSIIAIAAAIVARRNRRLTLSLHAVVYAVAAAIASGLLKDTTVTLVAPVAAGWSPPQPLMLIALTAITVVSVLPVHDPLEDWGVLTGALRFVLVSFLLWVALGTGVAGALLLADPRHLDVSVLATIRTAVLVAATLGVARIGRLESGREAGWLMYPLLVATGVKLLVADFPLGRPQTLFAVLALYGFTLIVAPRLLRRRRA